MPTGAEAHHRTLLDQIRSSPTLYRAAKRVQPAYWKWVSLNARVVRSLIRLPGMQQLLTNPTSTGVAAAMSEGEKGLSGLTSFAVQPDTCASRTLPPELAEFQRAAWSEVKNAHSGPGSIFALRDARVWGSAGAIITRDRRLLGDLSPIIRFRSDAHPVFRRPIIERPRRLEGRIAVVTGPSPENLSHWMFGALPRLSLLSQFDPGFRKTDWILVPQLHKGFQKECLRRFEIPTEKLIEVRPETFLEAREVIAPSFVSPAYVAPEWFLTDLRLRFADVPPAGSERIYVSRRTAPGRRVLNEDAVESMLVSRGFRVVQLELLPFVDQVALFKGAKVIVGAHGAGLSHLAFASSGAGVVELFAPSYLNSMYWCLADELGLCYRCCVGQSASQVVEHDLVRDNVTIAVDKLASIVDAIGNKVTKSLRSRT